MKINLSAYKEKQSSIFTGRPEGSAVRQKLNLDALDRNKNAQVTFVIPEDTTFFSPSFYLGLLFPSYQALGQDAFLKKYQFEIANNEPTIHNVVKMNLEDGHRNAVNSLKSHASLRGFFRL